MEDNTTVERNDVSHELSADQRPQAGEHLFHLKRFGHIVVGAGIEACDLVAPPAGTTTAFIR